MPILLVDPAVGHYGLDNRLIAGTPTSDTMGRVRRSPRLGGLLNFYERAA